jgi:hypothetical protein
MTSILIWVNEKCSFFSCHEQMLHFPLPEILNSDRRKNV